MSPSRPTSRDNLTVEEARRRAETLDDVHYGIELDLQRGASGYQGEVVCSFVLRDGASREGLFIDFTGRELLRVACNGRELTAEAWDGHRIALPADALETSNRVEVEYANDYDRTGSGFHHFKDPEDEREYIFSDFEPFKAHRLFPCFDQPDLKATFAFTVTAPAHWTVVSNGPVVATDPCEDGRTRRFFARTRPFSTYLAHVSAGEFASWGGVAGEIPMRILCRQSLVGHLEPDVAELFAVTADGFRFYEEYFGYPYPFAKYDQIFVPEFNAGAMENVGAVTHGEHMIFRGQSSASQRQGRAETFLHELAHMWFGNLVTMRWWDDLWLNESFATFASYLALTRATETWSDSWESFRSKIKAWAFRQDQLPTTHPIACEVPDTDATFLNFDGITYGKGASALKQLLAYIGDDAFREGMQRYFRRHAWGNATLADFLAALEEGSGRDLGSWSKAWIETSGLGALAPELRVADGKVAELTVVQEAAPPPGDDTLRPHRVELALFGKAGEASLGGEPTKIDVTVEGARTSVPDAVGLDAPAFLWLDHGDQAYAKIYLDDASLAFAKERLEVIDDGLTKLQLWGSLWEMVRDRRWKAVDYVGLVAAKSPLEESSEIVESALGNAVAALMRYVPERLREDARAPLVAAAWKAIEGKRDDVQLVWLRTLIHLSAAGDDLDRLSKLMDGEETIEGVKIDQPLRWAIVKRLIAFDRPGAADRLAAERERDASDKGRKSAFETEAAIPTAEAKAKAWAAFTAKDGERSDDFLKAGLTGFNWSHQKQALEPYAARFFAEAEKVHEERDAEYTRFFFFRLFPGHRVERSVLEQALAFAESTKVAQLQRMGRECADELRRSIECQELHEG